MHPRALGRTQRNVLSPSFHACASLECSCARWRCSFWPLLNAHHSPGLAPKNSTGGKCGWRARARCKKMGDSAQLPTSTDSPCSSVSGRRELCSTDLTSVVHKSCLPGRQHSVHAVTTLSISFSSAAPARASGTIKLELVPCANCDADMFCGPGANVMRGSVASRLARLQGLITSGAACTQY